MESKLLDTFLGALAERPAPVTEWVVGQHWFHLVKDEDTNLWDKIADLRSTGVKVLDYKKKTFGTHYIVKAMAPRVGVAT